VPYHIEKQGVELYEACLDRGLEGVMAKHRDSTYVPGQRSPFWLKVKAVKSDDFVVIGSTARRRGEPFGPLLVAYYEMGRLVPCGAVAGGYDDDVATTIADRLAELRVDECPMVPAPVMVAPVDWYRPELVISVRYSEWAPDGTLRFPIFNSLRPEVHPTECVRHRPRVVLAGRIQPGTAGHDLTRFPFWRRGGEGHCAGASLSPLTRHKVPSRHWDRSRARDRGPRAGVVPRRSYGGPAQPSTNRIGVQPS